MALDSAKKASQKERFEKVIVKIDTKKKEASKQFGLGSFGEAIKIYKSAAEVLETLLEDFPLYKKEIARSEAAIFNNIAFAYGRDENEKMQIEFCTKTIDRSPYIQDIGILIKAYLRRGLAYEHNEKYKKAANDLKMVRDLDNQNKQA